MNEEIEKAIDDLAKGDNVKFINQMNDIITDKLSKDETFIELGEEIEKYSPDDED